MMNRKKEIYSMDKESFKALFRDVYKQPPFVRLFNWGADSLDVDEREVIKAKLIAGGLKSPILSEELDLICGIISKRSAEQI